MKRANNNIFIESVSFRLYKFGSSAVDGSDIQIQQKILVNNGNGTRVIKKLAFCSHAHGANSKIETTSGFDERKKKSEKNVNVKNMRRNPKFREHSGYC